MGGLDRFANVGQVERDLNDGMLHERSVGCERKGYFGGSGVVRPEWAGVGLMGLMGLSRLLGVSSRRAN
jgi:hypothetical protein